MCVHSQMSAELSNLEEHMLCVFARVCAFSARGKDHREDAICDSC